MKIVFALLSLGFVVSAVESDDISGRILTARQEDALVTCASDQAKLDDVDVCISLEIGGRKQDEVNCADVELGVAIAINCFVQVCQVTCENNADFFENVLDQTQDGLGCNLDNACAISAAHPLTGGTQEYDNSNGADMLIPGTMAIATNIIVVYLR